MCRPFVLFSFFRLKINAAQANTTYTRTHFFQAAVKRRQEVRRGSHRLGLFHGENPDGAQTGPTSGDDDSISQLPHHLVGKYLTLPCIGVLMREG